MSKTRLAPSPTGALHLGNARTFLINWLLARQKNWKIALRIEDLDGPRIKPHATEELIADMRWIGLDWDEGPLVQSTQLATYQVAINRLIENKLVYPCVCSRKEIDLAASATHAEDGATVYPGTCRDRFSSVEHARQETGKSPALRFNVAQRVVEFEDSFCGHKKFEMAKLGDFVVAKADGTPAYQLAVVVDDLAAGVDQVIRGDDLLDSTPRQILLYQALGAENRVPNYTHLPLVIGEDGRRLAKRHGDTRLSAYRGAGVDFRRIRELLGRWCGLDDCSDWVKEFSLDRLSKEPIVFTPADDAWLRQK